MIITINNIWTNQDNCDSADRQIARGHNPLIYIQCICV